MQGHEPGAEVGGEPASGLAALERVAETARRLEAELGKAIVGQQRVIREILIAFVDESDGRWFWLGSLILLGVRRRGQR